MSVRLSCIVSLVLLFICAGCANITSPTGGKRDTRPPKMVSIDPQDSLLNTRVTRLEMHFNEYITVGDASKEVQISPMLSVDPIVLGKNKTVIVKIIDSLLEDNTTYRLSLGSAIRDLHEGNPFHNYTYTFSTGPYFDSLQLSGSITNALTGLPDTGHVAVGLYNAAENDSAIVRHKPRYITNTDASGNFIFKGLPRRAFRIYAVKDVNGNLIYDGPAQSEWVAFIDKEVVPGDTSLAAVNMLLFAEIPDTSTQKSLDSLATKKDRKRLGKQPPVDALTYSVNVDTSNVEKRLFDITGFITVSFSREPVLNKQKITITYDSLGITVTPSVTMVYDTLTHRLTINTDWRENMEYKLRLVKGFAKDTAGTDVVPSRYSFRTKEDDDYGKITLHLPARYSGSMYLLNILADNDSVYLKPVTDTTITLKRLKPGKYTFRIIVDKNHNGKWDTGDLLGKRQPEEVIAYRDHPEIKAGWENITDFDVSPLPKKQMGKGGIKGK
jgi:hypothetical protein